MKLNNEVWAFIPARSGSKSIKNKNIVLLKKKPLLAYSLLTAKGAKKIDRIIFSSDSKKYFNIAKKYANIIFHKRKKVILPKYVSLLFQYIYYMLIIFDKQDHTNNLIHYNL